LSTKWLAAELHTHTKHSDGQHSLVEMAQAAKARGIDILALTDHNTMSGQSEIREAFTATGVYIVKGIEYTTFFGHVLNLCTDEYVDWRRLNRFNLSNLLDKARSKGAVIGLAHPYRMGGVICTGCHMTYEIDYSKIDYIEVWSREFPSVAAYENEPSFALWDSLLNKGYKISGTSGRDWHRISEKEELPLAKTFIRLDEEPDIQTLDCLVAKAIRSGQTSVSMAHCVEANLADQQLTVSILDLGFNTEVSGLHIRLASSHGNLLHEDISVDKPLSYTVSDDVRWLRAELFGHIHGKEARIGFSNPIWV